MNNPPVMSGFAGAIGDAFSSLIKDMNNNNEYYSSVTHFWDADNGDILDCDLRSTTWLGTAQMTVPNAYQKMIRFAYSNKSWEIIKDFSQQGVYTFTQTNGQSISFTTVRLGFKYNTLIEMYTTGKAYITGWTRIATGQWVSCNYEVILSQYYRDLFTWEILGRMCHLLQDMSIPAHVHRDTHGKNIDGIRIDSYESFFGYDFEFNYYSIYNNYGGFLNANNSSNPLHYLMYTTAQMADHFGTNGPYEGDGNDIIGGNPLPEEISYLNVMNVSSFGNPVALTNPLSNSEILNIRSKMIPQAIRATAGLLYWFATQVGLATASLVPITSVALCGNKSLYQGMTGWWGVEVSDGIEPFTYQWEIYYFNNSNLLATRTITPNLVVSGQWVTVGTNSPTFNKSFTTGDLRSFKLRCTVKDGNNTTKVSNEFNVSVVNTPPPQSGMVAVNNEEIKAVKAIVDESLPADYDLQQNYPNPFNPTTKIIYSLPQASFTTLKIYDMLGREVACLVNELKSAGTHEVEFNASSVGGLSSGMYVYKINAGSFQSVKKMILAK